MKLNGKLWTKYLSEKAVLISYKSQVDASYQKASFYLENINISKVYRMKFRILVAYTEGYFNWFIKVESIYLDI